MTLPEHSDRCRPLNMRELLEPGETLPERVPEDIGVKVCAPGCPWDAEQRRAAKAIALNDTARVVGTGETAPQRQDSLIDQLRDLQVIANRFGLYDAADWIGDYLGGRR